MLNTDALKYVSEEYLDKPRLSLDEAKDIERGMLVAFKAFCEEHGLSYFLAYGTLLGAVRHKGFIPWDDDIDVLMPREDYNRFIELSSSKPVGPNMRVGVPGDENYRMPFTKIWDERTITFEKISIERKYRIGITIDIFPLDKYHKSVVLNKLLIMKAAFWLLALSTRSATGISGSSRLVLFCKKIMVMLVKNKTVEDLSSRVNAIGDRNIKLKKYRLGNLTVAKYVFNDNYDASYFNDAVEVEFEGDSYRAPVGYHEYLTELYGDYMKLPKEEDREQHDFAAYWRIEV